MEKRSKRANNLRKYLMECSNGYDDDIIIYDTINHFGDGIFCTFNVLNTKTYSVLELVDINNPDKVVDMLVIDDDLVKKFDTDELLILKVLRTPLRVQ